MRPPLRRAFARMLKVRCPRCGEGRLFKSTFVRAERCHCCDWEYEREEGYWVGGSEVHMFASYGLSVIVFIPLLIFLGPTPLVQAGVILGHIVCSLLMFRFSRSVFIGLDYYFDPTCKADDDDEDGGLPLKPRPDRPLFAGRQLRIKPSAEQPSGRPAKTPIRNVPQRS
ncbi:MAG: hypothetical protein AAGD14_18615 [Planctomycetota bacterium]